MVSSSYIVKNQPQIDKHVPCKIVSGVQSRSLWNANYAANSSNNLCACQGIHDRNLLSPPAESHEVILIWIIIATTPAWDEVIVSFLDVELLLFGSCTKEFHSVSASVIMYFNLGTGY